ncbi:tripartite tricarboxylate transporter substrate binding protein [Ramlibacter sp. WS9]|nr:tripartite tricarboxylate transporter substrate binding protein [Ramlibacter sp. WS9]
MMRLLFSLLLACVCTLAAAQETRRLVVPAPPGGNLDRTARLIAQRMSAVTHDVYIVENRPGANTMIATELVAKSPPDGRTLLLGATSLVMISSLQKTSLSPLQDLVPVMQISSERYGLAVPVGSPLRSLADVQVFASTNGPGINCLSVPGTTLIACEQLKHAVGGKSVTVPYAGVAPALTALVGGHGDVMFVHMEAGVKLSESGKIRLLGVSHRDGLPAAVAGLPLLSQTWPDMFLEGFSGVFVPAGTPPGRIRELNRDLNLAQSDPGFKAALREAGQDSIGGTPEHFAETTRRLSQRYESLIRKLDLGPR